MADSLLFDDLKIGGMRNIMNDIEFRSVINRQIPMILEMSRGRNILIYGAGHGGEICLESFYDAGVKLKCFVDRKSETKKRYCGIPVINLAQVNPVTDYLVVSIMSFCRGLTQEFSRYGLSRDDYYIAAAGEFFIKEDIIYEGCPIGAYTYGYQSFCEYSGMVKSIGRYCSINKTARAVDNHFVDCVTTHPVISGYIGMVWEKDCARQQYIADYKERSHHQGIGSIVIENDVWIGANSIITAGVTIHNGAIIGAGAVVTHDVEAYSIVGGIPARHIRYRFSEEIREALQKIQWWNWDRETIEKNIGLFYFPEKFVKVFNESIENI